MQQSTHQVTIRPYVGDVTHSTLHRAHCVCGWQSAGYRGRAQAVRVGMRHEEVNAEAPA